MSGIRELIGSLPALISALEQDNGEASATASAASAAADKFWLGGPVTAKVYGNITHHVETKGLDIMNANTALGGARALFEESKPSSLGNATSTKNDWVESDTDEQLMLLVPFQGSVKIHSIQITSIIPADVDEDDDESPSRPKTIKLFSNTHQILGFDEADERQATQVIELKSEDWNKDGTAVIPTKFVKFQNCTSVNIFFVDVERDGGEKVRVDRLRFIGEINGEKVDMAKLKAQEEE